MSKLTPGIKYTPKLVKTPLTRKNSFPEKAIFFYLSTTFENIVANYKAEWLCGKELDIYLPSLHLAIEYDGQAWHQDIEKDLEKNRLCEHAGVRLIRVREPGCPALPVECIVLKSLLNDALEEAIKQVCAILEKTIEIDIYRDRFKIQKMIDACAYKNSLEYRFPHMAAEWHPTKNEGILPSQIPYSSALLVCWKCLKCQCEWEATPNSRTANKQTPGGSGCPRCAGKVVVPGKNDLESNYPELAKEWHPTKNGSLLPSMVCKSNSKPVWWKCSKCGYEWEKAISSRAFNGTTCPACADRVLVPKKNDLATTHPEIATEWHPTLNEGLTPSMVRANDVWYDVWWLCEECGTVYQTKVKYHVKSKTGSCPTCRRKRQTETLRKNFLKNKH